MVSCATQLADTSPGNPKGCEWGNMSWGHSVSKDMITWERSWPEPDKPVLEPSTTYDKEGVFTGCFWPTGPRGEKGQLTVFYTAVSRLPMHWTLPYIRGMESLAAAVSRDGGESWTKLAENPILKEEPEGVDVLGWRDPYLASWPEMDRVRGEKALYGLISGSIKGKGPNVFLYAVKPDDLTQWTYLYPLLDLPNNFKPSHKWSADLGCNIECTNFLSLSSGGRAMQFLVTGAEGGKEQDWIVKDRSPSWPQRTTRWCQWLCGDLERDANGKVRFAHTFSGVLDHGVLYAVSTFIDPKSGRRIAWGWLPEEDLPTNMCVAKGWNGCFGVPRELFLYTLKNVTGALSSPLEDVACMKATQTAEGMYDLQTLGIRPLSELYALRGNTLFHGKGLTMPAGGHTVVATLVRSVQCRIKVTINVRPGSRSAGLLLRHDADMTSCTKVLFVPESETIAVDRSRSNQDPSVGKRPHQGPFTLFSQVVQGVEVREKLDLTIFIDGDIVEVFANNRFAMSTMIYSPPGATGISLIAEGADKSVTFEEVKISDMQIA